MNTSALKTFAPAVRRQLMEAVTRKLDYVLTAQTPDLLTTFAPQVAALRKLAQADRAGLIDRVAYTWFNRFAALRFMDARGWHPFRARVLTPASAAETQPELLKLTRTGALPEELKSHTDPTRLNDLLDGRIPSPDAQGEVYRHLVLAACRFYHALLPNLFEKLDDETELLLPDDLLTEHSVVHGFRTEISDADCGDDQRANVEILGWLYQFYISERKDQVMARKSAVPTEDIPAVTQLFTPHWIVRYLIENSLGRLWLLNRPGSRLRQHMPYYIEDSVVEPPAWRPEWRDKGIDFREHDCSTFLWLRPNPAFQGDYEHALWYAMTIDGYAYARSHWGIADAISGADASDKVDAIKAAGWENASFGDLRCCLFLIQRSIKWSEGGGPTPDLLEDFNACHAALCQAWDREWRENQLLLPDLSRFGIPSAPGGSPDDFLKITKPEEIRLCDPAVGSGHMLTYAFDLLTLIYEEEGYAPTEIPALILRHNLHGLEICPRAAQLAELALVFKAREKSRRFFQPEHLVRPHIIELQDVCFEQGELSAYFKALEIQPSSVHPQLVYLLHQFEEAKNFGSLIQPCLTEAEIQAARSQIQNRQSQIQNGDLLVAWTHLKVLRVLEQAEALTQGYHVVVANPPYMGSKGMNASLKNWANKNYPDSKPDLFAMFIERNMKLAVKKGWVAMVTMQSWMFLSSYETLRSNLLTHQHLSTLIQIGYNSFPELNSKVAQACAFAFENTTRTSTSVCIDLNDAPQSADKEEVFLGKVANGTAYRVKQTIFRSIPGNPIALGASDNVIALFTQNRAIGDEVLLREGIHTADNERFLRMWHEVARELFSASETSYETIDANGAKWIPYNKGGSYRKWYGNNELVVCFDKNSREAMAQLQGHVRPSQSLYFKKGGTWSALTSGRFAVRYYPDGFLFDSKGQALVGNRYKYCIGMLNTELFSYLAKLIMPTLDYKCGDVRKLPFLYLDRPEIEESVDAMIEMARADWDNFETSWDFRDQPLLRPGLKGATLEASWRNWEAQSTAAIHRMQELETENNRLFIAAYGLEGELQPEVPEAQITLARPEARRDIAAFLSYAVGCMMGRYSPDHPGLILANAGDSLREFLEKVGKPPAELTFAPDEDGIIPVLDGEWFEDDIVARTRDFLRATFGEATLRENLRFLEDSLGKDLRKYFLNDFYKDHLQTYRKRPIYWLVQSPKKGFQCLIYLHRYTRDTLNLVLNRYLREYQVKLRNRLERLAQAQLTASTARQKTEARKETEKFTKVLHECEDWERQTLLPLAQQRLELDLDDGVKVNYLKLDEALAPIPGLAAKEE